MDYRMAGPSDFPAIREFLDGTEYFHPVNPSDIGGHWIIAEHDGKIRGTVWCFIEAPQCFVDYWAANGAVVAAKVIECLRKFCVVNGVRFVHGIIASNNLPAQRLALQGFEALVAGPYTRMFKELPNGEPENGTEHDDTGAGLARDAAPEAILRTS